MRRFFNLFIGPALVAATLAASMLLTQLQAPAQNQSMIGPAISPRISVAPSISWSNTASTNFSVPFTQQLFMPYLQGHRVAGILSGVSTSSTNQVTWTNSFDVSIDGTNWSNVGYLRVTNLTLNGTTKVYQPFVFDFTLVDGFEWLKWTGATGISSTSYVTLSLELSDTP